MFQIHQQGAAGIAHVCGMDCSATELPQEPAVYRSKTEITLGRGTACSGLVIEKPADFARAEIGVEHQAGLGSPARFKAACLPLLTEIGGAAVLPNQSRAAGAAIASFPERGGFTLIGDSAADYGLALLWRDRLLKAAHRQALALPDRRRTLFYPAIGGVMNFKRGGSAGDWAPIRIEESSA